MMIPILRPFCVKSRICNRFRQNVRVRSCDKRVTERQLEVAEEIGKISVESGLFLANLRIYEGFRRNDRSRIKVMCSVVG